MRSITPVLILMGGFLTAAGCQKENAGPLVPAAGTVEAIDNAVSELATARCKHEQTCGRVGDARTYSDQDHCMNVMRANARNQLNSCRLGIDQKDFQECLTEISNQDCSGVMDDLEQYLACRADDLCLEQDS